MTRFYIISLDPAQLNDYSALTVIEHADTTYRIEWLRRKRGLPYTDIVSWSKKVFLNPRYRKDTTYPTVFVLDIGGVGKAIQDMMTSADVPTTGIQYTGGAAVTREGGNYHVSKSFIVGKFLAAWDDGRVQMPANASFLNMFQSELKAFRGEMSSQGRARFEAEQGEHDDLVMSVAQAVWWGEHASPKPIGPLVFGGAVKTSINSATGGGSNWVSQASDDMVRAHRQSSR
ncbi:MAG: hypothetical protein WC455_21510 [Dehalococcoidia bacterium]|jgi:hypothetical protein